MSRAHQLKGNRLADTCRRWHMSSLMYLKDRSKYRSKYRRYIHVTQAHLTDLKHRRDDVQTDASLPSEAF